MKKFIIKNRIWIIIILLVIILPIFSCVHIPEEGYADRVYGFWWGFWNGLTIFFSFFGEWLGHCGIQIYAKENAGLIYDFGFWLGAGGLGFIIHLISGHND